MSGVWSMTVSMMDKIAGTAAAVTGAILYRPTEPTLLPTMMPEGGIHLQADEHLLPYPPAPEFTTREVSPPGDIEMGEDRPCSPGRDPTVYEEFIV